MAKILGIAGGTASGKTTVAKKLKELAEPYGKVSMLRLDDYYKDMSHLSLEERKQINFDHPDSYDFDLILQHIQYCCLQAYLFMNIEKIRRFFREAGNIPALNFP